MPLNFHNKQTALFIPYFNYQNQDFIDEAKKIK